MSEKQQKTYELALQVIHNRLTIVEFSTLIGKSYSTAQRIIKKVKKDGMLGVQHGNQGKIPWNKTPDELIEDVTNLLRNDYSRFNLTHFKEMLEVHEGIVLGKNIIHRLAVKNRLVKRPKRRKKKVHKLRPRMPQAGMLIQFDGSEHEWINNIVCDLVGGIDDATGEVVGAEFFIGETSLHCMKVMQDIIESKGVPHAFYLDGAGYFGKHDRETNTQIARAFGDVNCECIIAGSAQAKGRIERLWNTFQDRLIAELDFYQIQNIPAANKFLKEDFLPRYNKKFGIPARIVEPAYQTLKRHNLKNIFCRKTPRKIGQGQQFSYQNKLFIINEDRSYAYRRVWINEHLDGTTTYDIMGREVKVKEYSPTKRKEHLSIAA